MINNTKGKLGGSCCYLSGPMEFAKDNGVVWRREFINLAINADLEIDFIDPTNKPCDESDIIEDKEYQIKLQESGDYLKLRDYVKKYRRFDLRFVDLSDFLVAVIDPKIHMCGTYNEIFVAEQQHKPMFFICEGGLKTLPRWLFDVVDLNEPSKGKRCNVFENLHEVINELKDIDCGEKTMSDQWVLIRKKIERLRSQKPH